jgi:hypothetical protein
LLPNIGYAKEEDLFREWKVALKYRITVILAGPVFARLATERRPTVMVWKGGVGLLVRILVRILKDNIAFGGTAWCIFD